MNNMTDTMRNEKESKTEEVEVTNNDIVKFMRNFQLKVEDNFKKASDEVGEIRMRMNNINTNMETLRTEVKQNETKSIHREKRMESRLQMLENEMKSLNMRRQSKEELRKQSEQLSIRDEEVVNEKVIENDDKEDDEEDDDDDETNLSNTGSSYTSQWARDLEKTEKEKEKRDNEKRKKVNYYVPGTEAAREALSDKEDPEETKIKDNELKRKRESRRSEEEERKRKNLDAIKKKEKKEKEKRKCEEKKKWFAELSSEEEEQGEVWDKVERLSKNKEKNEKKRKLRRKKMIDTFNKANHMIGLGPVKKRSIDYHYNLTKDYDLAKEEAVKEFLEFYLKFSKEEIEELDIVETKISNGDDEVIYIAVEDDEQIKNIHRRKAECRNDDIIIRNFIPPQIWKRFMELNRICGERRKIDSNLRTQIRFGKQDLELLVKERGTDEPFRFVNLETFLENDVLPGYDYNIKWEHKPDRPPRRKVTASPNRGFLPSLLNAVSVEGGISRQLSNSSSEAGNAKRSKTVSSESNTKTNKMNADIRDFNSEKSTEMETEEKDESI